MCKSKCAAVFNSRQANLKDLSQNYVVNLFCITHVYFCTLLLLNTIVVGVGLKPGGHVV
jgi:hypothetical protein